MWCLCVLVNCADTIHILEVRFLQWTVERLRWAVAWGKRTQVTEAGDLELHVPLGGTILVNHTDLLVTLATLRQELDLVKQENKAQLDLMTGENSATRQEL